MNHWKHAVRLCATLLLLTISTVPALATVHLMQVERVIGGVEGDSTAQAIQLRMRASLQNHTEQSRLVVVDAEGKNPIVLSAPATAVTQSGTGSTILFATPAFSNFTNPPAVPDFVMNAIPASYLSAGSLQFESTLSGTYWRVSWGGGGYTGVTRGTTFNDLDGQFAPVFAGPLPSDTLGGLIFTGGPTAMSTNNAADYVVDGAATVFRNNAGDSYTVESSATASPAVALATRLATLNPSFPNPFNPQTNFSYVLRADAFVSLRVYGLDGSLVDVVHQGFDRAGEHRSTWRGVDSSGRPVASGVYLVRLDAGQESTSRTVTLVK